MQKTLTYIEYAMFAVAVVCVLLIIFVVGDTDILAEPPTWVTLLLTSLGALCAVIGAGLHWVGLPTKQNSSKKK
ncbi:MAG: hypothetical protein VCD00_03595 [Candidatus Hydrogenedentota bacterium]